MWILVGVALVVKRKESGRLFFAVEDTGKVHRTTALADMVVT